MLVAAVSIAVALATRPVVGVAVALAGTVGVYAWSLPGAAGDGVLVGAGIPLISMISWHHPGHRPAGAIASAVLAVIVLARVRRWRPRQRGYAALGAFWMSVPVGLCAVAAAVIVRSDHAGANPTGLGGVATTGHGLIVPTGLGGVVPIGHGGIPVGLGGAAPTYLGGGIPPVGSAGPGSIALRLIDLILVIAVLRLVVTAARRRSRDLSVGVVAGLLGSLALLVAVRADRIFDAGGLADGRLLGWPADLVGFAGVAVAGRIGPDRAFTRGRRIAALGIAAALLLLAGSATAYATALVAALAYALFATRRETGTRGALRLAWRVPDARRAIVGGLLPVAALAALMGLALWTGRLGTDWTGMRQRDGLPTLRVVHTGLAGLLLGTPLGLLAGICLLIGAARVLWRVTGPGLPLWVPVVGLGGLVSVLAGGPSGSPAWLLVACAELWVVCRCLRTDRDTAPLPRPGIRAGTVVLMPEIPPVEELTAPRGHP